MNPNTAMKISLELIEKAERACGKDADLREAAGLVYVGDIYAMLTAMGETPASPLAPKIGEHDNNSVWPFLR